MRISDWSSDVCSSDLLERRNLAFLGKAIDRPFPGFEVGCDLLKREDLALDFSHPETIRSGLSLITIAKFSQFYQAAVGAGQLHNPGSIGRLIASSPRKSGHAVVPIPCGAKRARSEEHTSELQSLMRISYAVFCLIKKNQ